MLNFTFEYSLLKQHDVFAQINYSKQIYSFLFLLNYEYPNFTRWYQSLFNNNHLLQKDREILLCSIDDRVVGVSVLKNNRDGKKICTLRVSPEYQGLGIGSKLLEKSFEIFNDDKPLITIHVSKYHEFKRLFERYNFTLEQQIQGYYGLLRSELSYNGLLSNQIEKETSFLEQVAFGIEKRIYHYPSIESKIFIPNPIKEFRPSFLTGNL